MIRINAKAIGIETPIKVNETLHNVKESFKFQRDVIKVTRPSGKNEADEVMNYYDGQIKSIGYIVDYITDILNLNDKQIKKLNSVDFPKVNALASQIVTKMLHYDQADKKQNKGKKSRRKK